MFKKTKIVKPLIFCCSIFFTFSLTNIVLFTSKYNEKVQKNEIKNNSQNNVLENNVNTNWLNGSTVPSGYNSFKPLAVSDNSKGIVFDKGYIGISNDNSTIYAINFAGYMMWGLNPLNNSFVRRYYSDNNMQTNEVKIQQWLYLENKSALALLLGTDYNTNQTILFLDIYTGLLYKPQLDEYLNVVSTPIIKLSDQSNNSSFKRIYKISENALVAANIGTLSENKNIVKITLNDNNTVSKTNLLISINSNSGVNETTSILTSIIYTNFGFNLLLLTDTNPQSDGNYLQKVIAINNNAQSISSVVNLNGYFTNLDNNSVMDFNFSKEINGTKQIFVLNGNTKNRFLNIINFTGTSSNPIIEKQTNYANLNGYEINTICFDSLHNLIYVANKSSYNGSVIGFIDVSKSTFKYSNILSTVNTTFNKSYAIPMLDKNISGSSPIVLFLNQTGEMNYAIKSGTNLNGFFQPIKTPLNLVGWNANDFYINIKNSTITKDYMPTAIGINQIKNYFSLTSTNNNETLGYKRNSYNDTNGTLSLQVNISYRSPFDNAINGSFYIPIFLNGFYQLNNENYNFQFVTSPSIDPTKWNNIENIKKTKLAKSVTIQEVYDYFWIGHIKDKNYNLINIDTSMFSINGNFGNLSQLVVNFNLPQNQMPIGFPNSKLNVSYTYSGFLSTSGFELSSKSNQEIDIFSRTIYPSQLTLDMIINNFVNYGQQIYLDPSYWIYEIKDVNDFLGTATISLKYNYLAANNIPDLANFPVDRFSVFENKQINTFKNLKSSFTNNLKPKFNEYKNDYLPSEIWNQFVAYKKNEVDQSILLDNLIFPLLENKNNIKIELMNKLSCDADGFLNLSIFIDDNATLNIEYNGNQFQKNNNKLVFDNFLHEQISTNLIDYYPFNTSFFINTISKFFLILGPNGIPIKQENNIYQMNLQDFKNDNSFVISNTKFADQITEQDIKKLIKTQGYNYSISEYIVNNEKGYIEVQFDLKLSSPPLVPNSQNFLNIKTKDISDDFIPNNSIRTLIIYNFKVPPPPIFKVISIIIYCVIALIIVALISWFTTWMVQKRKFNKLAVDKHIQEENERKYKNINKKLSLTYKIKNKKSKK